MSHATMLEHIKADLDRVDAESLLSIQEIIDRSLRKVSALSDKAKTAHTGRSTSSRQPMKFVGENLLPEEYQRLSLDDRGELQWRLKTQNRAWLQESFSKLDAAWLIVVDGKIIASGRSLKDRPMQPQVLEVCRRTGKFPFVFINDKFVTIEENVSPWHATNQIDDHYPTLPITVSSFDGAVEVVGDFDTGATHTFVDYDLLASRNLIRYEDGDYSEASFHLSRRYSYIGKFLRIALSTESGQTHTLNTWVHCVPRWHASPFIAINPKRVALIGRDILLKLKPKVLLDFEQCQTEIMASGKTRQTRKSIVGRKKRTSRRRR